jgi:branched-chain amino acid transport system permease protein
MTALAQRVRAARYRNEVATIVAVFVAVQLLPKGMPLGVYGLGLVSGAALVPHALGIILVYRANGFLNFAQVQIGALAAGIFSMSVRYLPMPRLVRSVCPPCMERVSSGAIQVNYWASLLFSLALSLGLGYLVYAFVVRRFAKAPRLMVTVATIFLARALPGIAQLVGNQMTTRVQRANGVLVSGPAPLPFDFVVKVAPAQFHVAEVLTVVVAIAAAAALFVYLRVSTTGTAMRAAAENPARAATLGVDVAKVTSRVWIIVGLLSGLAGALVMMSGGAGSAAQAGANPLDVTTLVVILAVAVVARMTSLPLAVAGALAFGVLREAMLWSFGSSVPFEGSLVVIIAVLLLLQGGKRSRAETAQLAAWDAAREVRPVPRELRRLPVVRKSMIGGAVAVMVVCLGYPWVMSPAQTDLGAVVLIYGVIGLSLLVLTGWAGQVSLGQFAFAAIGGYTAAVWHLPFPIALVAGGLAGAVVALFVGFPALKLHGAHLAISTLAFALATSSVLLNRRYLGRHLPSGLKRPVILGMDLDDGRVFYYFCLCVLALVTAGIVGLRRSRTARALIAARDNDLAAQAFGINLVRARLMAFVISGFVAALAGALFAFHLHGVQEGGFGTDQSLTMFLMTVIGGLGSIAGPLVGALYLGVITIFGASPLVAVLATSVGGLLLVLLVPGGLAKVFFDLRDTALRRVASRYDIVVASLTSDRLGAGGGNGPAPLAPKTRAGGKAAFVPARYRLHHQWAIGVESAIVTAGTPGSNEADEAAEDSGRFEGVAAQ